MKISNLPQGEKDMITVALRNLGTMMFENSEAHGFWKRDHVTRELAPRNRGEMIALIHSELSEMLEGIRKPGLKDQHLLNFSAEKVEWADTMIRMLDYAASYGEKEFLEFIEAIFQKAIYNEGRPIMHGGKAF